MADTATRELTMCELDGVVGAVSYAGESHSYPNLGAAGQDAGALCILVLMSATKSAQADLKAIMGDVRQINHSRTHH
jgi:hypothetical protein